MFVRGNKIENLTFWLLKLWFEINDKVKSNNGLQPLVELIKDHSNHDNKELMAAVTGIQLIAAVKG